MVLYYQVDQLHRVALPAFIMLQNYEKYSILPNIFATFFALFFNFNNPPLLRDNAGLLTDKDGLIERNLSLFQEVILAKVLAARGQLVMHQRGQHFL